MAASAHDLARWTRFAAKGGIGRCTATVDCVASQIGDLMFLKDDEIIVLMQLREVGYYLGFCEGVVGRFSGTDVQFHGKLKRPIMAKRGSLAVADSRSLSIERVSPSWSESLNATRADSSSSVRPGSSAASSDPRPGSSTARRTPLSPDMHSYPSSPEHTREYERSKGRAHELTASVSVSSAYSAASTSSAASTAFSDAEDSRDSEESFLSSEEVPSSSGSGQASSSTKPAPASSSSRTMERLLKSLSSSSPISQSTSGLISPAPDSMSGAPRDSSSTSFAPTSNSPSSSTNFVTNAMKGISVAPLRLTKSPRLTANSASPPVSPLPPQPTSPASISQPRLDALSSPTSPRYSPLSQRTALPSSFSLPAASSPPRSPLPPPPQSPPSPPSTASSAPESEGDESSLYLYGHDHEHDESTQLSTLHRHMKGAEDDEDGETGIGLSLLGALAMDEEDDDDDDDDKDENESAAGDVDRREVESRVRKDRHGLHDGSGEGTPIPWTKYEPSVSASPTVEHEVKGREPRTLSANDPAQDYSMEQDDEPEHRLENEGTAEEEEEEEGYWDRASDIYDDYRYSRYSMASKRMSGMSVKSKSRMSILPGGKVPPVPSFSPDRSSFDTTSRPSVSSGRPSMSSGWPSISSTSSQSQPDRANIPSTYTHASVSIYSRPSLESTSSADPGSPVTFEPTPLGPVDGPEVRLRPPVARQVSADNESTRTPSMYSTRTLSPLSAQFPKVPTGVPSRLRAMNADNEDEGESGSGSESGGLGLGLGVGLGVGGETTLSHAHAINPVSPLLYASFGANGRNSGYTEETERQSSAYSESDEGHGLRKSRALRSDTESVRSPTSPGIASALRMHTESKRESRVGLGMRAIVVDDDEDEHPLSMSGDVQTDEGVEGETSFTLSETGTASTGHTVTPASLLPSTTVAPSAHTAAALMRTPSTITPGPQPIPEAPLALTPGAPSALTPGTPLAPSSGTTMSDQDASTPSTLRPRQPNQASHPFSRTSIFLPHPNAPKIAPGVATLGPMYARPQQADMPPNATSGAIPLVQPPSNATAFSVQVLRHIRNVSLGPGGRRPPITLYARCEPDLNQSPGPVPIMFSLDPLPALPYMPPAAHQGATAYLHAPSRAATVSAPSRRSSAVPDALAPLRGAPPSSAKDTSPNASADPNSNSTLRLPRRSATILESVQEPAASSSSPTGAAPISRPNFIPQVGATRPRSRSFSGFGETANVGTLPERSREEPVSKMAATPAPVSTPSPSSQPTPIAPPTTNGLPASLRARHIPSPLSIQSGNLSRERSPISSTTSPNPNASQLRSPTSPTLQQPLSASQFGLKPPSIASASPVPSSPAMTSSSPMNFSDREKNASPASAMTGRTSVSTHPHSVASPQPWVNNVRHGSSDIPSKNSVDGTSPRKSSDSTDSRSQMPSPPPIAEWHSQSARSSPLAHEVPLRGKLSLPALRNKAGTRSKLDDTISVTSSSGNHESETVQVQDMDFELVKPALPQVSLGRSSQESSYTGHDADAPSMIHGDTMSMHSNAPRSPMFPDAISSEVPPTESSTSIDAHRQREVKWMALLPVVPPSQARKNKKVKRLLLEGVPSSVRYLVWCHLTDSKARAIPGVYAQLGKRPRVAAFSDIEKDAKMNFPEQPQLHPSDGPLASLLQAYLSMVPDIQYSSGLTSISGHLLLLSPEEDAFWIFTSMMDAHLRPYFSANTIQLEVDAALLSKAIEANDPGVFKKLYVTLGITPGTIAKPLFSTLFVGTLPVEYLHRIWDIFLFEGVTLLIRVGLTLIQCVRHLLLQAPSEDVAMEYLLHPPLACLPSMADAFLNQVLSMKLKDDDVRKQRIKMESRLKRQTQSRTLSTNGPSGMQIASISLPKAS